MDSKVTPRPAERELTPRQVEYIRTIVSFCTKHERYPNLAELGKLLGMSRKSHRRSGAKYALDSLARKGWVFYRGTGNGRQYRLRGLKLTASVDNTPAGQLLAGVLAGTHRAA
jgi:hypothetical protein